MRLSTLLLALTPAMSLGAAPLEATDEATDETGDHSEWITRAVNLLSDCAGFYDFMSDVAEADGKPASAEQVGNFANGARSAAGWLLAVEYAAKHEKPKLIGEFSPYVDGRADVAKARMKALSEQLDTEEVTATRERCIAALPMQEEIIQKIRNDSVGR